MGDLLGNLVFFLLLLLCKEEGIFLDHLLSFIIVYYVSFFIFFFVWFDGIIFVSDFLKFIFDEYYLNELVNGHSQVLY